MSRRPWLLLRLGLWPLLAAVVIGCTLLVINGVLVSSFYHSRSQRLSDFWRNPRVAQAVLFLGPVMILGIQWWAYDTLVDWIRPIQYRPSKPRTEDGDT